MRMMLRNVSSWRVVHVRMSANGAAHGLAKLMLKENQYGKFLEVSKKEIFI
jgi:hypothetical protein